MGKLPNIIRQWWASIWKAMSLPIGAISQIVGEELMQYVHLTLYDFAQRDVGVKEFAGGLDNPLIMAMLRLTGDDTWTGWPSHDEVPWCSAAMNFWCRYLRLPRSKNLQARSWLSVGKVIALEDAKPMNDVVIMKRGGQDEPGPEVMLPDGSYPPGHVALFSRIEGNRIWVLGGNQSNTVSVASFPLERVIGVRRLLG